MDGFLQAVYLKRLSRTVGNHQGYARGATTVCRPSESSFFLGRGLLPRCAAEQVRKPPLPDPIRPSRQLPNSERADIRVSSRRSLSQEENLLRAFLRPRLPHEFQARLGVRDLSMEGPTTTRVRLHSLS